MSLLLALALFWLVGKFLAACADNASDSAFQKGKIHKQEYELFFANVYVIAWDFYQRLEPQVLSACAETEEFWYLEGHEGSVPGTQEMERFSYKVFGETITRKSIQLALQRMKDLRIPIYEPNTNLKEKQKFGFEWVKIERDAINFQTLSYPIEQKIPKLGDRYAWGFTDLVTDKDIRSYIPERSDPRTYEYTNTDPNGALLGWPTIQRGGNAIYQTEQPSKPYKEYKW